MVHASKGEGDMGDQRLLRAKEGNMSRGLQTHNTREGNNENVGEYSKTVPDETLFGLEYPFDLLVLYGLAVVSSLLPSNMYTSTCNRHYTLRSTTGRSTMYTGY